MKLNVYLFGICLFVSLACKKKADDPEPALVTDPMEESIKKGLTAYYPLSGDWNDISGNKYHALVTAGKWVEDRKGKANNALEFNDLTNQSMEIPGSLLKRGGSYSFWFYKSDAQKQFCVWNNTFTRPEKMAGVTKDATYGIKIYTPGINQNLTFEYHVGFTPKIQVQIPYGLNGWNFFVISFIDSTISYPFPTFKVYLNGKLVFKSDTDPIAINAPETSVPSRLGGNPQINSNKSIEGRIDDIGIWSRLLTDDEIVYMFLKK